MTDRPAFRYALSLLLVPVIIGTAAAQSGHQSPEEYLRSMGADAEQLRDAENGTPFVRLLPSRQDRDVFVLGAVVVPVSPTAYLTQALEPGRLIGAASVRFHYIAAPATSADVQELAWDEGEYRSLRDCRPDHCKFKLPAPAMKDFADAIDWKAPSAKSDADNRLRNWILELTAQYRAHGNAALPHYDDTRGTPAAEAFSELLAQATGTYGFAPELEQYLAEAPHFRPQHTRDVIYWSEDRLPRLRPTLTLNHVVVYTPPTGPAVVARKMLYADHYFESAIELLTVAPRTGDSTAWLITVRRLRFDNLPRSLFNIRGRVTTKLVDLTRSDLERERKASATTVGRK